MAKKGHRIFLSKLNVRDDIHGGRGDGDGYHGGDCVRGNYGADADRSYRNGRSSHLNSQNCNHDEPAGNNHSRHNRCQHLC